MEGIELRPMPSRKLTAVLALTGLLTTVSVADTSLCRMFCATHMASVESSKPAAAPHLHHSALSPQDSSLHAHANLCTGNQQSIVSCGGSVLESPRCTQYRQLAKFLEASRVTVTEKIPGDGNHALLLVVPMAEISEAAPSPPNSPPGSYTFPRSTPTLLRI